MVAVEKNHPDGGCVESRKMDRQEYVRLVLECYCRTPGTTGYPRQSDRQLANKLFDQDVPLSVVDAALVVATARRELRPAEYPPLAPVRSFYYFLPVIDEISENPLAPDYVEYLRAKLHRHLSSRQAQENREYRKRVCERRR
jgi:hypothetical protein